MDFLKKYWPQITAVALAGAALVFVSGKTHGPDVRRKTNDNETPKSGAGRPKMGAKK